MPKAKDVASELRKLADALDKEPETLLPKATVWFHYVGKPEFLAIARLMLRPFKKSLRCYGSNPDLHLTYASLVMAIYAVAPQSQACRMVRPAIPAEFDCEPLLSEAEEAELTA